MSNKILNIESKSRKAITGDQGGHRKSNVWGDLMDKI